MTLSFEDVFTPAPSGVGQNPPASGSWLAQLLTNATTLQLAVTAWQSGGMGRTIMAIVANMLMLQDVNTSVMAQGTFLDFAATGTVTYTDPNSGQVVTQYVTPDPSNPATWPDPSTQPGPGWLDILADSNYNVQRFPAESASGNLTINNTSATTFGPFAPGTYHVANAAGFTFSNVNSLTITPGTLSNVPFAADIPGKASTTAPGTIVFPVTALVGVSVTNPAQFVGVDPESNPAVAARCRVKLQSLGTGGTSGSYTYWAETAYQILQALNPPITLQGGRITSVSTVLSPSTGNLQVYVANSGSATPGNPIVTGATNLQITGATNASPIVLTVTSTFGLATGMPGLVTGVQGNPAANGYWPSFTVVDGTHVSLDGSTGNGAYTGGGVLEAGDLGLVDSILQANAVPLTVTAQTVSAIAQGLTVVIAVSVPAAQGSAVVAALTAATTQYVASVPVGGFVAGVLFPNSMPLEGLVGALFLAAPYIRDVTVLLNGAPLDVLVGAQDKLVLAFGSPTIVVSVF
jgi:hypothetical protein